MGKTTFMKKIGWDWAKGIFIQFYIVFFVFLKFVQPGEAIENIIIEQNPKLEGMSLTPEKLRQILEVFGPKCLLILDGLDEHALGQNQDVLKIIKGQKLLYCNMIVTSRTHSCANVEQYFQTIVRVNGFTRCQAERFALRILKDKSKVEAVMNFNPWGKSGFGFENEYLHNCPILLLILCVLVKDGMVDLNSASLSKGELYFSFVQFLYQKYASCNGITFKQNAFEDVVKKLAKLAWETLQTGNPFLTRNKVIAEVGKDAFKYGILIGHEDMRLLSKIKADILVTFVHRTVQEFLGAFHFFQKLCEGERIPSLLDSSNQSIHFLSDHLFLHFCLWCVSQKDILLANQALAYKTMTDYVLPKLDIVQLEIDVIGHIFPALDLRDGYCKNDRFVAKFFFDITRHLSQVKCLSLKTDYKISEPISEFIDTSFESLSRIILRDDEWSFSAVTSRSDDRFSESKIGRMTWLEYVEHFHNDGDFDIVHHQTCEKDIVGSLLARCASTTRDPSVYLFPKSHDKIELSDFLQGTPKKMFIVNVYGSSLRCSGEIKPCPDLTHLYLIGAFKNPFPCIDFKFFSALSAAVNKGYLCKLTHLSFEDSRFGLTGTLNLLLKCTWQSLRELNLRECYLRLQDFEALFSAYENCLLPQLKSLSICDIYRFGSSGIHSLFRGSWCSLTKLSVTNLCSGADQNLCEIFRHGKLPNVEQMVISRGPGQRQYDEGMRETLKIVARLQSFAVHTFSLDLQTLAKVVNMRNLKTLDVGGCTGVSGNMCVLLMGQAFPTLNSLALSNCRLTSDDLKSLAKGSVEGKLPVLRHLDISLNPECEDHLECLFHFSCTWPSLLTLNVQQHCIKQDSEARDRFPRNVEVLFCQVEAGCLSNIEEISLTTIIFPRIDQMGPWKRLKRVNILAPSDEILQVIVKMVEKKLLPSLEVLSVVVSNAIFPTGNSMRVLEAKYALAKSNICVYISGTSRKEHYLF